ncbi:metal ABC transporter ATP-binding protein [Propionicicella superfundia]|uniref:metal ABC transporter ATP-binding protein n=1 Tax=Propionicicella superfundia TaxID=348582 RepID=UPI0004265EC7|nr:ABC transporter ATP-binding protein [Propionicicella superfundia]
MSTASTPAVVVSHLGVSLGGLPVLRDVSCRVETGDVTALLGGNGAGKSTLLKAILGIRPHEGGDIDLFGRPLRSFREWHRIGYVPQRGSLQLRQATVTEVVSSGRLARRRPFFPPSQADRLAVGHAIEAVGLADRRRDAFADLSGGQQQRALIARALAGDPDLLLLDEPFAGVDLATQERVAEVLRDLHGEGRTLLIVLHELGPLAADIDSGIVLRNGRVISTGPLEAHQHHRDGHETVEPGGPPPLVAGVGEDVG